MNRENRPRRAILLAAGIGRRLGESHDGPKVLLEFGGRSLLARHVEALARNGIERLHVTVGYERARIEEALARIAPPIEVVLTENANFREGSLVSLHAQSAVLRAGEPVLLMDGDVLYDPRLIVRLLAAGGENVLLVDRDIEPGDEPVKICFRGDAIVDFRKLPLNAHDRHGESVGFFRFSAATAADLAERCAAYVSEGRTMVEYEEAIRDLILRDPARFRAEDITDLPWTEIDFAEDVARARDEILPRLSPERVA